MVLAGLIIAIRTTSSCSSMSVQGGGRASRIPSPESRSLLGCIEFEACLGGSPGFGDADACAVVARICPGLCILQTVQTK